jgi:aspartyl-tRNA(Asn)/glutamyl-tRNA(Gln) amidotransferase subunit C
MQITREEVRRVAELARLDLSGEEEERLVAELGAILSYVEKLGELDTAVPPTAQAIDGAGALRDDEVTNTPEVDRLLANAPDPWQGFFRVPKIIE